MNQARLIEQTISYNGVSFKFNGRNWFVQTFGFHISNPNASSPSYRWYEIDENKIPKEVKKLVK